MTEDRLLTVQQVADILGCSAQQVYKTIWNRELTATRVGRFQRVSWNDLDNYLNALPVEPVELDLHPTVDVAAERLASSTQAIYRAAHENKLQLYRCGAAYVVGSESLERFLWDQRTDVHPELVKRTRGAA